MKDIAPLSSILDEKSRQEKFVSRLIERIEYHLGQMGAFKGIVARKTYAAIKAVRPNYVEHILSVLSRDYLKEYSPMHDEYRTAQHLPAETIQPLHAYVSAHADEAKMHFWRIADGYAERRKEHFLGKLYTKFRPTIEELLPTISQEISKIIEEFTVSDIKSEDNA